MAALILQNLVNTTKIKPVKAHAKIATIKVANMEFMSIAIHMGMFHIRFAGFASRALV